MTRFDTTLAHKSGKPKHFPRGGLIAMAAGSILISFVILALGIYEGFFHSGKIRLLQAPGFHELDLKTTGLYAGLYQHSGNKPMPVEALTKLDVRVMSKDDYEEIPVLMNSAGNTFSQFGVKGMPLFNFAIDRPGAYTLSAVYTGGVDGPKIPLYLVPQSAQNIKQTLFVALAFFALFLGLGIFLFFKMDAWAPAGKKADLAKK